MSANYGLKVVGDSIVDASGGMSYPDGAMIVTDPTLEPAVGDDIVVQLSDGAVMFKRLELDSEAFAEFSQLPDRLTIYRGTVQAEHDSGRYGVCWTLDRDRAVWFATAHARFRNTKFPPIVLRTTIRRVDASGFLIERKEREVLVVVDSLLYQIEVESMDVIAAP